MMKHRQHAQATHAMQGASLAPTPGRERAQLLALAALLIGAVGISLSPIFVRLADVGPLSSAFWRTGLAVPLFLLLPLLLPASPVSGMQKTAARPPLHRPAMPNTRRDLLLLMLAGGFFAADLGAWHIAIGMTSVANATLFPNLAPVIVTLVAWLAFGERITGVFVAGLALALGGAVIVIGSSAGIGGESGEAAGAAAGTGNVTGDLLALLVAVFYAGYLLTVSRLRRRLGVLAIMTFSSAFAALPLGLAAWLLEGSGSGGLMALLPSSLGGLAVLLGLALISQVAGQGLIAQALAHLPVSFSSVGLLLQPALAALFGWLLLNEAPGTMQLAGMGIILLGIWLARRGSSGSR